MKFANNFLKFSNFSDSSEKSDETQKSSISIRTRTLPKVQNKFICLSVSNPGLYENFIAKKIVFCGFCNTVKD